MSTNNLRDTKQSRSDASNPFLTDSAEAKRLLRGAAAAQAGFDYQLDVSILATLRHPVGVNAVLSEKQTGISQ